MVFRHAHIPRKGSGSNNNLYCKIIVVFVYLSIFSFVFLYINKVVINASDFILCSLVNYPFLKNSKSKLLIYLEVMVATNLRNADNYFGSQVEGDLEPYWTIHCEIGAIKRLKAPAVDHAATVPFVVIIKIQ